MPTHHQDRIAGVLLGTAIGDALGLPAEGLNPVAIRKRGWAGNWHHRFFGKHGMWSDDTEHAIMLGQSLLVSGGDSCRFAKALASELRWWLIGLPAGVGLATARAILRLWMGFPPHRSGVFSAGNGPCMRTAVIGACFPDDEAKRRAFVEAHTLMTHTDPKALIAARAITELAALFVGLIEPPPPQLVLDRLAEAAGGNEEWRGITRTMETAWKSRRSLGTYLRSMGIDANKGVGGYAWHTVPAAIYSGIVNEWRFRETVSSVLDAGGDTDSVAAIAGALCGAARGTATLPEEWLDGIAEWPVGIEDLRKLAQALATGEKLRIRPRWSPLLFSRNLFFLLIALAHGFTRPFYR
ncbi:MAG: ADP-ribosylglycohydrolase family protein [Akkermansiaceae bacterium]|nr:ADP-ribosylglycohydrolase family protein [Akkermansiaceae bacterium]